jgi:glucuronosyltransferase
MVCSFLQVPNNVHLLPWVPQNDILGHAKTKLFVAHGGCYGQYEAVYHGVPMIGVPLFAEQGWNCVRARQKGIALCLDLLTFTADELHNTVQELIDNATYRSNIRRLSGILHDAPMDGCQKAGFWINHVMKYGGEHLRSPALDQPQYQFLMFDVIIIILLVTLATTTASYLTCTWLLKKCCKRWKKNKKD